MTNRERAVEFLAKNSALYYEDAIVAITADLDEAERRGEERMRERAAAFVDDIDSLIGLHIRALPLPGKMS